MRSQSLFPGLVLQDVLCMDRPAFNVCCPFLGLGTWLLELWASSWLGWLLQRPPACLVVMPWVVLSTGFPLCALRRAVGFPEADSWVWSLHISSCQVLVISSELNSLTQKELPVKLTLQCLFWTGSKRNSRFYICARAAGVPDSYSDKFLWRNSLKS